jgi:hypothetical protein
LANGAVTHLKLASGMVAQVVNREVYEASQLTSAGSFHELTSDLRLAITPYFTNSTLYFEFFANFVSPNSSNLAYCKVYDQTNSAEVNLPSAAGSRRAVHWSKRTSPVDGNDMDTLYMTASVTSGSTNARTYTIYHSTEGATHQFYQSSLSNGSGTSSKMHFRITECVN